MSSVAAQDQQFGFVQQLAKDLAADEINLPSFPTVIMKIRAMLEDEECDFAKLSDVVSADATLVSRLFIFANSSYHNRSGEEVTSLSDAISRLGLELVRNTALALAVKQLVLSGKHKAIAMNLRQIWIASMQFSSLSHAVASYTDDVREEEAFMCGLFHDIGKVYILTKARDFPAFLGDKETLQSVLNEWHTQIGRCVVEAWGFPDDVIRSMSPLEHFNERTHLQPKLADVVYAATLLHRIDVEEWPEVVTHPIFNKLNIGPGDVAELSDRFKSKLDSIQQTLS